MRILKYFQTEEGVNASLGSKLICLQNEKSKELRASNVTRGLIELGGCGSWRY